MPPTGPPWPGSWPPSHPRPPPPPVHGRSPASGRVPAPPARAPARLPRLPGAARPPRARAHLALRARETPPVLRGLVRAPLRQAANSARPWGDRLSGLRAAEQEALLLDLVCSPLATLLGHPSGAAVEAERGFLDLGMSSLTGVELRNRLNAETSLRLPTTLIFDHPTPVSLARHLRALLSPDGVQAALPPVFAELGDLETAVAGSALDADARAQLVTRLKRLQWKLDAAERPAPDTDLVASTDDEIFEAINKELGLT